MKKFSFIILYVAIEIILLLTASYIRNSYPQYRNLVGLVSISLSSIIGLIIILQVTKNKVSKLALSIIFSTLAIIPIVMLINNLR